MNFYLKFGFVRIVAVSLADSVVGLCSALEIKSYLDPFGCYFMTENVKFYYSTSQIILLARGFL